MKYHLLISAVFAVLVACEKEPVTDQEPDPEEYDCSLQVSDSNLVVGTAERNDSLVFHLENRDSIIRPLSCFSDYAVDTAAWSMKLVYADSSEQFLPYFGSLEIHEDSIRVDPYDWAPLTAIVNFRIPYSRRVKIRVHGRDESIPDITHIFPEPGTDHSIPVYGLYADFHNNVTLSILDNQGTERAIRTVHIRPEPLGRIDCGPMTVTTDLYEDTLGLKFFLIQNTIYDSRGDIRWFSRYTGFKFFLLHDNLIAIQLYNDKGVPAPKVQDIRVMNLLGREVALYDVPNRNHHEIIEKTPGGNLLVATNSEPYHTTADDTEDAIVEIDRHTGEVARFWDLREIFDPTRPRIWTEMPNDWCHLNSIQYDSTDNTLLISSKLQYFISKIDYESGAIRWIFGNHENWKEPWQEYLLDPLNFDTSVHPDQDWTYAQHMARLTGDGNVIVYDNGRKRPDVDFTRIHEFRVDSLNGTVETIWTHDFDYSTRTMGSVQVLENDNVLIGHGERGILMEITREGGVVFEGKVKTYYRAYPVEFYQ